MSTADGNAEPTSDQACPADAVSEFHVETVSAGSVLYPTGGTYGPRLQPNIQLVLVHTGSVTVWIDGERHDVEAGRTALLRPGHSEMFAFSEREETRHGWIHIKVAEPDSVANRVLQDLPFTVPLSDSMIRLTELVISITRTMPPGKEQDALLASFGTSAIRLYRAESVHRDLQETHPAVRTVKAEIASRYVEAISLGSLARTAGVTPEHLIRLFRRETGMTPIQLLWRTRVERSVELLRSTGLTVGEIADRTGFRTSYHLARLVKRETGRTPTEIRRSALEPPR